MLRFRPVPDGLPYRVHVGRSRFEAVRSPHAVPEGPRNRGHVDLPAGRPLAETGATTLPVRRHT